MVNWLTDEGLAKIWRDFGKIQYVRFADSLKPFNQLTALLILMV